jgi:hypothetical protein
MQKEELYISYITKDVSISGTTTSDATEKLIDAGALFLTGATPISQDDFVTNTSTNQTAKVITVDSDTQITLNKDIFPLGSSPIGYKINKQITERIELLESLKPNLTFNISDIAKPDQRKSDFSKTIRLPASKKIRKVFENIFEINIDLQTFNPNLKTDVLYLVDGEINLEGYLQLKKINILDNDDIVFECTLLGNTANFIQALGDKELDDTTMLWSNLNHNWTKAIQQSSWTATPGVGYVYPLIDYGFSNNFTATQFSVNQIYPAAFVKEYVDRMFDAAGFTYNSTFFNSAPFEDLIIPFNSKEFNLTDTAISNRLFDANTIEYLFPSGTTSRTITKALASSVTNSDIVPVTMSVENDPNFVFDSSTGFYTCNQTGTYDFYFEVDLTGTFEPLQYGGAAPIIDLECCSVIRGNIKIKHLDSANNPIGGPFNSGTVGWSNFNITYSGTIPVGTSSVTTTGTSFPDNDYINDANSFQTFNQGLLTTTEGICDFETDYQNPPTSNYNPRTGASQPNRYIVKASNIFVQATEKIIVSLGANTYVDRFVVNELYQQYQTGVFTTWTYDPLPRFKGVGAVNFLTMHTGNVTLNLSGGVFRNRVVNNTYAEGNLINMNAAIPKKIKQKDFFMSLVKMFNLYIEPDKNDEKNLFIEPRDDFYDNIIQDWSQKLDVSQDLEYLPMGALDSKEYLFTYKQDKDYYNELYNTTWNEIYGQEEEEIENDFINNKYKTELIFSPTPSVGQTYYDRVIPAIKKYDDNNGNIRTESNIRILQWGGLKDNSVTWAHLSVLAGNTNETQYPYAGHLDDAFNPTVDINFGFTNEIYWDDTFYDITLNNNNLYNAYYKKFIEEITDVNSKIVRGWFYLRPSDIRNLSFKNQYYFDGAYFRLNKIENYNPTNPITKCEFLKLKDANVFVIATATPTGGTATLAGKSLPYFKRGEAKLIDGNTVSERNVTVKGVNNYVDPNARNVDIIGDNNFVFADSSNVFIRGNGNSVEGVRDVSLINTNDKQVINSETTYINGQIRGAGSVVNIVSSITADESVATYLVDTNAGSVIVDLPTDATVGKIWNVKVVNNTNECQLRCVGRTIDGFTTIKITQVNTCLSVQFDGNDYKII